MSLRVGLYAVSLFAHPYGSIPIGLPATIPHAIARGGSRLCFFTNSKIDTNIWLGVRACVVFNGS